ncbi:peptide deformylase [Clostridium cylindrosporum]|uniref:Peptide deformylase n=1 Tax=Clostridium cylindrosporum DSM 605 TaxID=1121307 RepID=A0A0J8D5P0_CLOCY|nr:peptide deformylase [Clostridium cylindrosporum]KMT21450.1 peptide deformylase Def [Clostridium cylindrosporum DSM 605]
MALREIRKMGDEVLRKKSRNVDKFDDKLRILIEDMIETMNAAEGVGLAAPQIGILKNVVVIDIGDGNGVYKLINPEIISSEGSQTDDEGCLSIPGVFEQVERPNVVTVKAQDENGNEIVVTGEGFLARAFCHELDHLNGVLFVDKVNK